MEKETRKLSAGDILMNEGEKSTEMFYLISGSLQAFKTSEDGEKVVLGTINEKEFIGEMSFFKEMDRTASVEALGDAEVVVFAFDKFKAMLGALPPWYNDLVMTLISRLKGAQDKLTT